jgi:hypothetical protein
MEKEVTYQVVIPESLQTAAKNRNRVSRLQQAEWTAEHERIKSRPDCYYGKPLYNTVTDDSARAMALGNFDPAPLARTADEPTVKTYTAAEVNCTVPHLAPPTNKKVATRSHRRADRKIPVRRHEPSGHIPPRTPLQPIPEGMSVNPASLSHRQRWRRSHSHCQRSERSALQLPEARPDV